MAVKTGLTNAGDVVDAELEQALKDFRSSVHAWGDAAYSRPRQTERTIHLLSWRVAAGWALGCALAAGTASGVLFERHHRQELAKAAAVEATKQQAMENEQRASVQDEDLLAKVNSDVSRQAPSAMEPLAQLMADDEVQ